MTENYLARLVFPSVFHEYIFKKKDFKKNELIKFCYEQKKIQPDGLSRSNQGGWHSRIYNINEDNPISELLKKGLGKSVFTTLQQTLRVDVSYWIMINSPNTYNCGHTHPNSHLSGVVWVKTTKKSGDLKFTNPNCFEKYNELKSYIEKFKTDTNVFEASHYLPIEGKMITFPSHIFHEVQLNKSKQDRIAISYNIVLTGWGDKDN